VGLYPGRVTGLAYEPSWLAHQLNMLYLPLWLAASVQRLSAHRFRLWFLTFENLLLAGGVVILLLSFSRVGLAAFLLMLGYLFLAANAALVRKVEGRFLQRYGGRARKALVAGITLALILMYVLLIVSAAFGLSRIDPRMQTLFDLSTLRQEGILEYANRMFFAERLVYWQAGWGVFNDHPILGVGLGNAGYYFPQTMSDYGLGLVEVNDLLGKSASLPNAKSLWVRLLAETGIVGFALFITWLFVLWAGTGRLRQSAHPVQRIVALATRFVLLGLLIEGFSVDTFALPYFWVTFGLLTAALAVPQIGRENPER
jgi:O-antigen ligase